MLPREPQPLPALKSLSKFEGLKFVMSRALSLSFCFLSCGDLKILAAMPAHAPSMPESKRAWSRVATVTRTLHLRAEPAQELHRGGVHA